jgi:hypothetical protein
MNHDILFYASRYALGRMTYAVSEVAGEIIRQADELSPKMRANIIREIDEAFDRGRLGMKVDAEQWHRVRAALVELEKEPEALQDN